MSRIDDFIQAVGDSRFQIEDSTPEDGRLLSLVVHVAFADGHISEGEFEVIQRMQPHRSAGELILWVAEEAERPLDLDALLAAYPALDDRRKLADFAERVLRKDAHFSSAEIAIAGRLRSAAKA